MFVHKGVFIDLTKDVATTDVISDLRRAGKPSQLG